ncbi:MAG: hypothetical protein WBN19_13070 [Lutimonas sp.]
MKTKILKKLALTCLGLIAFMANAQEPEAEKSTEQIAIDLANPNTTLGTMNFNFDYVNYQGDLPKAGSQNSFVMGFQPVLPIPLSNSVNLFVRPQIPLYFTQPTYGVNGFENQGVSLGNISADVAVGKTFPSKTIGVLGVFGSFRTASNEALRSNYTLLGPELMFAQITNWGVFGLMVNHAWSVNKLDADPDNFTILADDMWATAAGGESASITAGQYFYAINLTNGWQIQGSPTYSYNHKAEKGNKLILPIGTGATKVMVFGKMPVKFNLQYWYYVASPEVFGPQHQIRFTVSPVVQLPW